MRDKVYNINAFEIKHFMYMNSNVGDGYILASKIFVFQKKKNKNLKQNAIKII